MYKQASLSSKIGNHSQETAEKKAAEEVLPKKKKDKNYTN